MSKSVVLDPGGSWRLRDFAPDQELLAGAHLADYDDADWDPASMPGDVHTALVEVERLAPPFYNMNVETYQWVEEQEWWYRTKFEALPDDHQARAR